MLKCFCGVLFVPLYQQQFVCISREPKSSLRSPKARHLLGWAGQSRTGQQKAGAMLRNALSSFNLFKGSCTFKGSSHFMQGKLASMTNGREETLLSVRNRLSVQGERLQVLSGTQKQCMIPGKVINLWRTCKGKRQGSWRHPLALYHECHSSSKVLTGHSFVPAEGWPLHQQGMISPYYWMERNSRGKRIERGLRRPSCSVQCH